MTDFDRLSDEKLIDACKSGEQLAWEALVSRYERLVYTVPARYGLTPSEVEDVFQTVWMSLIKNLNKIRDPERISAWLVTTARRECWERRRGADFERTFNTDLDTLLEDDHGDELSPEQVVVRYREHLVLRQAFDRLGVRCRRLLWLLYYEASIPSYNDIAERLKMPIGSIGPMRARCLKKLGDLLNDLTGEDVSETDDNPL